MRYLLAPVLLFISTLACHAKAAAPDVVQLRQQIADARTAGNMDLADQLGSAYFDIASQQSLETELAQAHFQLALNAMERNVYPLAKQHLEQAIALVQPAGETAFLARVLNRLGMVYRYQSDYANALKYVYQAMQIFTDLELQHDIASSYSNIGVILEKMGQFEQALQAHQQALDLHHQLQNKENFASAVYNLGDLHRILGDNEHALQYFQQSLQLDLASGDQRDIAYSHNKLGFLYADLGQLDNASKHASEALRLFELIGARRDSEWARTVVAKVAMAQGDYERAQQLLDTVIARASEHNYKSLLIDTYRMAAELALRKNDDSAALSYIEPAIVLAQQTHERADEAWLQQMRVAAYIRQDRVRDALNALRAQKQLEDDIFSSKRAATIAAIQAQTGYTLQQNQLELLQNKQQLQQAQLEQQRLVRNFWLLGLTAVFVLAISLYRRLLQSRQNRYLEQQVAARTAELTQKNDELALAYQQLETISLTDKLTGLHNRRFLESHIEADLEQYRRVQHNWQSGKTNKPDNAELALFIIDLDHFKTLNDTHGHDTGDAVLKQLRTLMQQVFRHSDYLVRWGGEEFVVVARDINRDEVHQLAQRFVSAVQHSVLSGDGFGPLQITCSVGYACYPLPLGDSAHHWSLLLKLADICLYAAKHSGRNGWVGLEQLSDSAALVSTSVSAEQLQAWQQQGLLQLQHSFGNTLNWQAS